MDMTVKSSISESIINWYSNHQRDLPWRKTRNPYFIWISEVMLQQTQVETVIPYYKRFLSKFPTIEILARASLQEVLKVWENMGYYSRAHNLHTAAKIILQKYHILIIFCLRLFQKLLEFKVFYRRQLFYKLGKKSNETNTLGTNRKIYKYSYISYLL